MPLAVAVASWPDTYWGAAEVTGPTSSPSSAASSGALDAPIPHGDFGRSPVSGGEVGRSSGANGGRGGALDAGEAGGPPETD